MFAISDVVVRTEAVLLRADSRGPHPCDGFHSPRNRTALARAPGGGASRPVTNRGLFWRAGRQRGAGHQRPKLHRLVGGRLGDGAAPPILGRCAGDPPRPHPGARLSENGQAVCAGAVIPGPAATSLVRTGVAGARATRSRSCPGPGRGAAERIAAAVDPVLRRRIAEVTLRRGPDAWPPGVAGPQSGRAGTDGAAGDGPNGTKGVTGDLRLPAEALCRNLSGGTAPAFPRLLWNWP